MASDKESDKRVRASTTRNLLYENISLLLLGLAALSGYSRFKSS